MLRHVVTFASKHNTCTLRLRIAKPRALPSPRYRQPNHLIVDPKQGGLLGVAAGPRAILYAKRYH